MIRRLAGIALGAIVVVLGIAMPAAAHDQLIASTPSDGEVLTALPEQIVLEYSAELVDAAPALVIQTQAGDTAHQAVPEIDGRFARSPFPDLPNGEYSLNWSVVSSDGHRIEGTVAFELALAPDDSSPAPSTPETTVPADPIDDAVVPETTPSTSPAIGGLGTMPTSLKVIVGTAGIAAAGAVAVLLVRRLRTTGKDET